MHALMQLKKYKYALKISTFLMEHYLKYKYFAKIYVTTVQIYY